MKYLLIALLFPTLAMADKVVYDDGQEVTVPEGKKVVFVRDDAPTVCVEIDFLEIMMPRPEECDGLLVSPDRCD